MTTRGEDIDDTWPTTTIDAENIHWERVKTDEEVYLDKLQSKLERVMSHVVVESNSRGDVKHNRNTHTDKGSPVIDAEPDDGLSEEDEDVDNNNDNIVPPVDDEGLHLLYDQNPNHDSHVDYSEDNDNNLIAAETRTDQSSSNELVLDHNSSIPIDIHLEGEEGEGKARDYQENEQHDTPENTTTPTRPRIVRFRSRVRIGSGIRNISTSSSASSSISVPLRGSGSPESRPNLTAHTTASLTEMLTTDATNAWLSGLSAVRRAKRQQQQQSVVHNANSNSNIKPPTPTSTSTPTERTALLARVYSFAEPTENDVDGELNRIQTAVRKSEEDVMFGKWPWRLFNRYWWWWRVEPILCFCGRFDDESDSDI